MNWITYEINGQRQLGALLPDGEQVVPLRMLGIDLEYKDMVDRICKKLNFTTLRYHRLDDMIASVGMDRSKLCTYCWDGKE